MKFALCNFLHYPVISSLLGPNILLSTLFFRHLQSMFYPWSERPSFTDIITGTTVVFYASVFMLLGKRWEDETF
jgi:hypothetical protein